ncbi:heme-binding protein [Streptomyces noursei]|uniref:heme-binding protein n=1 Tax=Streptomyces noursei TaxID=1971 RepID=UPI00382B8432
MEEHRVLRDPSVPGPAVGRGYPIIDDGQCVGGLGISGGSYEQDQQAAEEALAALGFEVPAH